MSEKYWLDKMNENPRYREIWEKIKELPFNETTEIILDLEAKLAESEESIKYLQGIKRYDIGELITKNGQLKQQLANMTEKYNACQEARKLEAEFSQQDKKELTKQLAEKDAEVQSWKDGTMVVKLCELEQQLAEKEELIIFADKTIKGLVLAKEIDKISFAVEKLQEAKRLLEEKYTYDVEESDFAVIYETDIDEIIDQQINNLRSK